MVERKVAFLVLLVGAQALWWLGLGVDGLLLLLLLLLLGLYAMADPERCLKKVWSGRKSCLSSLKLAL
jgi:hypothetical protein